MAFDFNSVIKDKRKDLLKTLEYSKFSTAFYVLLNEIESLNIFYQYKNYKLITDSRNNTISAIMDNSADSPFTEPRYIFKFIEEDKQIKIILYLRSGNKIKTGYLSSPLLKLIKYSTFTFAYCYIIDNFDDVLETSTLDIFTLEDTQTVDDYTYSFYKARLKPLSSRNEETVLTVELANKLPKFMNVTKCTFRRDVIFDSTNACKILLKKLYCNTHYNVYVSGYTADEIFRKGYKQDVINKFITIYDFKNKRSSSKAVLQLK